MTTVSGIVRIDKVSPVPNAGVTLVYARPLVGFDGGALVQTVKTFTADGDGLLTMSNLPPGHYDLTIHAPVTPGAAAVAPRSQRGTIPSDAGSTLDLDDFLDENAEPVTSSIGQQASGSAERAERAMGIARINAVSATRAIATADAGALLQVSSADAVTLTIPTDATAGWSDNLVVSILRDGVGACRIEAAPGVTLSGVVAGETTIADRFQFAQLVRMGANSWRVTGWVTEVTA